MPNGTKKKWAFILIVIAIRLSKFHRENFTNAWSSIVTGSTKLSQFTQELKSNLMNNVNDTLMNHPETSSTWL